MYRWHAPHLFVLMKCENGRNSIDQLRQAAPPTAQLHNLTTSHALYRCYPSLPRRLHSTDTAATMYMSSLLLHTRSQSMRLRSRSSRACFGMSVSPHHHQRNIIYTRYLASLCTRWLKTSAPFDGCGRACTSRQPCPNLR